MNVALGQIGQVEPIHLRDFLVISIALLSAVASFIAIVSSRTKQKREVSFSEQLVTKEFCSQASHETNRRLAALEDGVPPIWEAIKKDSDAIRSEMRKGFADLERALGRIEGRFMRKE